MSDENSNANLSKVIEILEDAAGLLGMHTGGGFGVSINTRKLRDGNAYEIRYGPFPSLEALRDFAGVAEDAAQTFFDASIHPNDIEEDDAAVATPASAAT